MDLTLKLSLEFVVLQFVNFYSVDASHCKFHHYIATFMCVAIQVHENFPLYSIFVFNIISEIAFAQWV